MGIFSLLVMSMISVTLAQQHQYYRPQAVHQQVQQQQPVYREQPQQPLPVILSHKQALGQDGSFRYQFAADNGLQQGESIAPDGTRTGQYSYVDPDGQKIMIKYVAGKDGFRVLEGDHLPRAPQVPAPAQPQPQPQPQQQLYQQPQYQYQQPQQQYQQPQQQYQQPQQQYQQPQQQPRYYQGQKVDDGSYRSEDHDEGQYDPRVYEVEENNNNNNNQYQTQSFRNERGPHKFGPGYAFEING